MSGSSQVEELSVKDLESFTEMFLLCREENLSCAWVCLAFVMIICNHIIGSSAFSVRSLLLPLSGKGCVPSCSKGQVDCSDHQC